MEQAMTIGPAIYVATQGPVATVVLRNPGKRNAMTLAMWDQLEETVKKLVDEPEVRVIMLRGEGKEAFSAGADITEFPERRTAPVDARRYAESVGAAQAALGSARKPTIALLHGACAGGGASIALSCGLRFCDERLRFSIPAAKLGVVYDYTTVDRLAREIGPSGALDVLISGRTIEAAEALRLGLVNDVVPQENLEHHALEYAKRVVENAPLSVEGALLAVRAHERPYEERWRRELAELERRTYESADYQEGVAAFLEKRRPTFLGV
jgi:enoyl-CoA hydratase